MKGQIVLSEKQAETAVSYADGAERVMAELGIDRATLNEALLDWNVERCPHCGWYDEAGALTNEDGDVDGHCDNCRRYAASSKQQTEEE